MDAFPLGQRGGPLIMHITVVLFHFKKRLPQLTTRTRRPMAKEGRFFLNWARTAPLLPWGRVILPQMTRRRLGLSWPGQAVFLETQQQKKTLRIIEQQNVRKANDPHSPYLQGFFAVQLHYTINPLQIVGLHLSILQQEDRPSFSFLVTQ